VATRGYCNSPRRNLPGLAACQQRTLLAAFWPRYRLKHIGRTSSTRGVVWVRVRQYFIPFMASSMSANRNYCAVRWPFACTTSISPSLRLSLTQRFLPPSTPAEQRRGRGAGLGCRCLAIFALGSRVLLLGRTRYIRPPPPTYCLPLLVSRGLPPHIPSCDAVGRRLPYRLIPPALLCHTCPQRARLAA